MEKPVTKSEWLVDSIMTRRGLAAGVVGKTHRLDHARQGTYRYTIGRYAESVLEIQPGDRVLIETEDAFEGKIASEADSPSAKLELPFVNPQNGPILVTGAEKGDVLAVYVEAIRPRGPQPRGTTCFLPEMGGLVGTTYTATLNPPLPERVYKTNVDEEYVYWSKRIRLPYAPFLGTIGTAPEIDSISSLWPGNHGGNMDLPDTAPGNVIYLPVRAPGAYLYLGDCHAAQGDGELCGVAVEIASETAIVVDLIKGWKISWPRIEHADWIMSVGSVRPMEDAARIAYRDLIYWMADDYGFDRAEAYMLLTQCGRVRLGNMVDPNYTIGASVAKQYLMPERAPAAA
jgi:acetamidase/formamidase